MGEYNAITAQEIAVIRAMAMAGHSAAAIGRFLGRTGSCIIKHAPECGQRYFNWATWTLKKVPAPVARRATDAAKRYQMPVETLVYQIAAAQLMKGNVHRCLNLYAEYETGRKLNVATGHSTAERKRANGEADMDGEYLTPSEV
jgi:hypothetical protein